MILCEFRISHGRLSGICTLISLGFQHNSKQFQQQSNCLDSSWSSRMDALWSQSNGQNQDGDSNHVQTLPHLRHQFLPGEFANRDAAFTLDYISHSIKLVSWFYSVDCELDRFLRFAVELIMSCLLQINLSNSFLRDIVRILTGNCIHTLNIEYQAYDYDKPNLWVLSVETNIIIINLIELIN